MKNLIEFKLDNGESAFMQVQESEEQARHRVSRSREVEQSQTLQAERTFNEAIRCISPIGKSLLAELKEINTPEEIKLEFGVSFNAQAGVVFTSIASETSFSISITWKDK